MRSSLLLFLVAFFVISCGRKDEKVIMNSVGGSWKKTSAQKFQFEIADAQMPRNIIFVVRNNSNYPYSNLRLFVDFKNEKSNKIEKDTLNYILAKPNGEWLGSGFGDTKEILFQYKTGYRFAEPGRYEITVQQAMRRDNLPGIEDIGIKIEQATSQK